MTTFQEVTAALEKMKDNELAQQWLHNDMIKMHLANSYVDSLDESEDYFTMEEHIVYYLEHADLFNKFFNLKKSQ